MERQASGESVPGADCPACGLAIRDGDDVVTVVGQHLHAGCADERPTESRRHPAVWSRLGSRGQLGLGPAQQDTSDFEAG